MKDEGGSQTSPKSKVQAQSTKPKVQSPKYKSTKYKAQSTKAQAFNLPPSSFDYRGVTHPGRTVTAWERGVRRGASASRPDQVQYRLTEG